MSYIHTVPTKVSIITSCIFNHHNLRIHFKHTNCVECAAIRPRTERLTTERIRNYQLHFFLSNWNCFHRKAFVVCDWVEFYCVFVDGKRCSCGRVCVRVSARRLASERTTSIQIDRKKAHTKFTIAVDLCVNVFGDLYNLDCNEKVSTLFMGFWCCRHCFIAPNLTFALDPHSVCFVR